MFGNFVYQSNTLNQTVASPFSIHIKVVDGQVSHLQFLEDTYTTAASFRAEGTWTVHNDPAAEAFRL